MAVSPAAFKRQMKLLKGRSMVGVNLSGLMEGIKKNGATANMVAITFDDGYRDNLLFALPILREFGFKATVFVIAHRIGSSLVHNKKWLDDYPDVAPEAYAYLDWDDVLELSRHGIEIGSHTCTHPLLDGLDAREQAYEIGESKHMIEETIGNRVDSFCYPSGRFTDETVKIVANAGYRQAVVTPWRPGLIGNGRYTLERASIYRHDDRLRYRLKTSPFFRSLRALKQRVLP